VEIGSLEWKQLIVDGARQFKLDLEAASVDLFAAHARELLQWNRKINLTAITDPREVAVKHYLDSIAPLRYLPRPTSFLDIGSGGGFPGIPMKIMMPDVPATLIDASRKKAGFLAHAGRLLDLDRYQAVHTRVEDLALRSPRRGEGRVSDSGTPGDRLPASFHLIVTRALTSINEFLSLGLPVLSENGMMVALKGRKSEAEIDDDRATRAGLSVTVHRYELPFLHLERSVVVLKTAPAARRGSPVQ
jgi:16S rRNA (guanine527-N7)-methyltransferase